MAKVGYYCLIHEPSGRYYIGSTGNFAVRRCNHIEVLKKGKHHVRELQQLYDESPSIRWVFNRCSDREEAYLCEQKELDTAFGKNCPLLLNKARNARKSHLGLSLSPEHRAKLMRAARASPHRHKASTLGKTWKHSEVTKEKHRRLKDEVAKPVVIMGQEYVSLREASRSLGIIYQTLRHRVLHPGQKWAEWSYKI